MNPVDHPHGGGEGKTSGGRSPVSPWGQSAKGLKTRRPKRSDKLIITRRKKRKKHSITLGKRIMEYFLYFILFCMICNGIVYVIQELIKEK